MGWSVNFIITIANVYGLNITYVHFTDVAGLVNDKKASSKLGSLLPPSRYDNTKINVLPSHLNMAKSEMLELKELHFNGAMINKPLVRKFIIKNNSGIDRKSVV